MFNEIIIRIDNGRGILSMLMTSSHHAYTAKVTRQQDAILLYDLDDRRRIFR